MWQYGPFCFITNNFISSLYFIFHIWVCSVQTSIVPSKEECYIKGRAVQIDKLKKKHFQSEAVLPLRFGARLLCEENYQSFRGLFRLSISLGTKAAHTCKSICKVACCFRNITWQKKLYPESALSQRACRLRNLFQCLYMFPPDCKKVVEIMRTLNIPPAFKWSLQAWALLLFPFLYPTIMTLPLCQSYLSAFFLEMAHWTEENSGNSVSWVCPHVSVECHCMIPLPCPRELTTENQEKIFCSGWAKANRKGKDIFLSLSIVPLFSISRNIKTEVNKTMTVSTHQHHILELLSSWQELVVSWPLLWTRVIRKQELIIVSLSIIMIVLIYCFQSSLQ